MNESSEKKDEIEEFLERQRAHEAMKKALSTGQLDLGALLNKSTKTEKKDSK